MGLHETPHATAFGKVMLASLDPKERARVLESRGLPALTRASVTNPSQLDEQLAEVARVGVAVEVDEFMSKLACVATPIRTSAGEVIGAVSASVSSAEFSRRRRALEHTVRNGAREVSAAMG